MRQCTCHAVCALDVSALSASPLHPTVSVLRAARVRPLYALGLGIGDQMLNDSEQDIVGCKRTTELSCHPYPFTS